MMRWFSKAQPAPDDTAIPVSEVVRVIREYAEFYPNKIGAAALREMALVFEASEDTVGDEWAEHPPPE